jgi:HAD superfamily hydrolase (TIGR01509 family)
MLKAVIFDMDGVLIDSEPLHHHTNQKLFSELGFSLTDDDHGSYIGTTSHYMWSQLKNKFNLSLSVEELVKTDRLTYMNYLKSQKDIAPINGIKKLIKDLYKNNVKLAVASSSPLDVIDVVVEAFQFNNYFDQLVTGDNVENSKPSPDIFLYAAKLLNIDPSESVVIEDSYNGVCAAKAAGMKCIGYRNLNSGNQDLSGADMIINSYSEINYELITRL